MLTYRYFMVKGKCVDKCFCTLNVMLQLTFSKVLLLFSRDVCTFNTSLIYTKDKFLFNKNVLYKENSIYTSAHISLKINLHFTIG